MLKRFGIEVENRDYREFYIKGNQKYKAQNYRVEEIIHRQPFGLLQDCLEIKLYVKI